MYHQYVFVVDESSTNQVLDASRHSDTVTKELHCSSSKSIHLTLQHSTQTTRRPGNCACRRFHFWNKCDFRHSETHIVLPKNL